ncbi:MAG: hypothetical protein M3550_12480 [Actinomycetota bacterium]|nr:hypothetical protein [Actinomycetota bacterium]
MPQRALNTFETSARDDGGVTAAILGLATGLAFGALLASGKVCFNSGLRHAGFEAR